VPLLDAPVSRATYRLGPGDALQIGIVGQFTRTQTVTVTPEGSVVLPEMGVVRVLGLSLDAAEERVRTLVGRFYRNVNVSLSLSAVRAFKVVVVGDVDAPGVRPANAASRVSELVPDDAGETVRHRNIVVRRANGDSLLADLARFRQTGDLSANPTLREGDALFVPTIDRTVAVYGRVRFPGTYEYRAGETLAELLSIANGAADFPSDAADTVRVTRFAGDVQRDLTVLTRAQATGSTGALALQPFDAVYVPGVANYRLARTATVTGQVRRPGTYPIRHDTTTLAELVALAGGFTDEASLADATLHRVPPRGADVVATRRIEGVPPDLLSAAERRVVAARTLGDSTLVVVDLERVFAAGRAAPGPRLEAGDSLNVPRRQTGVTVLGAVREPGIVPFRPGASIDEYVRSAGGYARRADRRNSAVLKAKYATLVTGQDRRDVRAVRPGDRIVVPLRPPRNYVRDAQTLLATASGLVIAVLSFRQLFPRR
jgi:protein involved in polysaccharide export with SLBB domain